MNTQETDVLIVGSGPNALSVAAQLRGRGIEHRIFGPPMKFWRDMPRGLNLKSLGFATNMYATEKGYTFPEWCRARGLEDFEPCPMESFASYGMWFRDRLVPHLEDVAVTQAAAHDGGFEVTVATGERHRGRRIVFATGLSYLANIPEVLRDLPRDVVTHTFNDHSYEPYRGKNVAVIGAGASAIEAGALVHEAGGTAQILVREKEAVFHGKMNRDRSLLEKLRYPNSVLGPSPKNWALENFPLGLYFAPARIRVPFVKTFLGPAAPWWIKDRVEGKVPILVRTTVIKAEAVGSRVRLTLRERDRADRTIEVDHVICGTGYHLDLDRLSYLHPGLRARMHRVEKAPALSMNFQSSVKGAYFVGPITAMCFGPLFRFVAGGAFAAPTVARHMAGPVREVTTAVRRWTSRPEPPAAALE